MFNLNFMLPASKKANKVFEFQDGAWVKVEDYQLGKYFKGVEVHVNNLKGAYEIFKESQEHPCIYIQGGFIEGVDLNNMVRQKAGDSPTIQDRYLQMVCLDIDGYKGTLQNFMEKELPFEFREADYIIQYSASFGLTKCTLNCHLFFWLENPIFNIEIRKWIKDYNRAKKWGNIIDPSVLTCNQPIYIQKRECSNETDPIDDADFIQYIKKNGNLNFDFGTIEVEDKITLVNHQADKLDIIESIQEIMSSENFHEAANRLAMSLLNDMTPRKVKKYIEGLFKAVSKKDERWQVRFDDIDRSIATGLEKMTDLSYTIDEFREWFESASMEEKRTDFPIKCAMLDLAEREEAKTIVGNYTPLPKKVINAYIKTAADDLESKKIELAKEHRKKERMGKGIHEIELTVANSGEVAEQVCKILAQSKKEPQVFTAGVGLVSVGLGKPKTIRQCHSLNSLGKDYPDMPIIQGYVKPFSRLNDRIKKDIMIQDSLGKDIDPTFRLLDVVGDGDSRHFLPLTGVIECPYIGSDWELRDKKGYNKKTGLFSVLHRKLKLNQMEPKEAYRYLIDVVLAEFPFRADIDKAVAVAAMMTAIQRPTISGDSGFPGFGIISPTQSSGKTTLAQLISYSVFNRPVAATTLSQDDVELSKHLLGILQEGHSCVLFDNIKQGSQVTSNVLSQIMTSDVFSGRMLGENKTVHVPCSVVWLFTGNGISFVGDFATRIYPININPKMEDPNTRRFKRADIGKWAMDNRKKIISALLSIVVCGKNIKDMDSGSRFREWDAFIRKPIHYVSGIDINDAVKNNQKEDPLLLVRANLIYQLHQEFGQVSFTAKEMINKAFGSFEDGETELGDAIVDLVGDKARNTKSIGRYLSTMTDVIFNNLVLTKRLSNITNWQVQKIEGK